MIGDELEQLRRANPVDAQRGERLSAPHASAFREALGDARRGGRRFGGADDTRPSPQYRLTLAAAAVALVAVPAVLLARSDAGEVIVRTPATNELQPADDTVDPVPPSTDDELFEPRVTTVERTEDNVEGSVDDTDSSTRDVATTTRPSSPDSGTESPDPAPAAAPPSDAADTSTPPTTDASTPAPSIPSGTTPVSAPTPPPITTPPTSPPITSPAAPPAGSATPTTTTEPESAPTTNATPAVDGPFDPATDVLMVSFDFAHLDDGHAALATRELTTTFGLDPIVVAGTNAPDNSQFTQSYPSIMTTGWGSGWLDATANRPAAVTEAVGRWLSTIDAGGHVWVAEGGVSDFTAEVLRDVRRQRPGLDTTGIVHVVHHINRNVTATRATDMELLETHADVVRIDDGNSLNGTADLFRPGDEFERLALDGPTADAWIAGFDYLPADSLDFSDTVTVLHVLGIGLDVVADPDDFAALTMT